MAHSAESEIDALALPSPDRMLLIQRYLLRQLMGPTFWALVALAAVGLLSQSLSGLDIIVDQRQSAWVFIKVTLLAMPQLIAMLLPVAVFIAALITLNRLQTEQEMIVCSAGGMSRWQVCSPAIRLAVIATLATLLINLWIQPWASRTLRDEIFAIRGDLAATLVREGEFIRPPGAPGLTVYAQEVGRQGLIKNLFIHQETENGQALSWTAREGRITRRGEAPVLIMFDGSAQEFKDGALQYGAFEEYVFDLSALGARSDTRRYKAGERYMRELFHPDLSQEWERANRNKLLAEAHSRLSGPLYNIAVMALALLAVLGGGFSRMGYARRIAIMGGVAAGVRILGFAVQAACDDSAALNVLQYLVPLAATGWAVGQFLRGPRQGRAPARLRTA